MMKNTVMQPFKMLMWICVIAMIFAACQTDEADPQTARENSKVSATENSQIVAVTEDVMAVTDEIFTSNGFSGGRTNGGGNGDHDDDYKDGKGSHHKLGCKPSISGSFDLDRSHQDSLIYTGTFTVDFGDGSTCTDSTRIRKGKVIDQVTLIVTFKDSLVFSSTEKITFEGFSKDTTLVDGIFIIKSESGSPTTVEAQDARVTYTDGTFFSWEGTHSYVYDKSGSRHAKGKTMKITRGTTTGTTRTGAAFTATIVKEITLKRGCFEKKGFVPVSGTVEVTTQGITSSLDYGDGTCDDEYTVSADGVLTKHKL